MGAVTGGLMPHAALAFSSVVAVEVSSASLAPPLYPRAEAHGVVTRGGRAAQVGVGVDDVSGHEFDERRIAGDVDGALACDGGG